MVLGRFIDIGVVDVKGKSILELGAGAAVPSIIAALNGASTVQWLLTFDVSRFLSLLNRGCGLTTRVSLSTQVVTTDYPDDVIIENIRINIGDNITEPDVAARVHAQVSLQSVLFMNSLHLHVANACDWSGLPVGQVARGTVDTE